MSIKDGEFLLAMNATQVRNEWSSVVDSVVRERPQFIKRTRDYLMLSNVDTIESILSVYSFHAQVFFEDDESVTVSLDEIDLVENDTDEEGARSKISKAILDYSDDYYNDFAYWGSGSRKSHLPYVLKALILNDADKIGGLLECRHRES